MRLASRFGAASLVRRDRSLAGDELVHFAPSVPTIRAAPEQVEQRLNFWLQYFGKLPQWILLESRIFSWLDRLCESYSGGLWDFHTLSNGGAFTAPDSDIKWSVYNEMKGNYTEMSSEAAGICACLLTFSPHACITVSSAMSEHFYHLREFALSHPESSAIMNIID